MLLLVFLSGAIHSFDAYCMTCSELVKQKDLHSGYNAEFDTLNLDEDKVGKRVLALGIS